MLEPLGCNKPVLPERPAQTGNQPKHGNAHT
jgi:hypothetical protein